MYLHSSRGASRSRLHHLAGTPHHHPSPPLPTPLPLASCLHTSNNHSLTCIRARPLQARAQHNPTFKSFVPSSKPKRCPLAPPIRILLLHTTLQPSHPNPQPVPYVPLYTTLATRIASSTSRYAVHSYNIRAARHAHHPGGGGGGVPLRQLFPPARLPKKRLRLGPSSSRPPAAYGPSQRLYPCSTNQYPAPPQYPSTRPSKSAASPLRPFEHHTCYPHRVQHVPIRCQPVRYPRRPPRPPCRWRRWRRPAPPAAACP